MENGAGADEHKTGRKTAKAVKDARISKDGKWRFFPQDSHLLQYVSTGMFYGRVKVSGKPIRRKLDTTTYTTAKLKLLEFLKEHKTNSSEASLSPMTFGEARKLYQSALEVDPSFAAKTVTYKLFNLKLIDRTWPELADLKLSNITPAAAIAWSGRLNKEVSAEAYNHTLGVFKNVFERGAQEFKRGGGGILENPASSVKRLGVKPKKLQLPEPDQFLKLVAAVADAGGGFSKPCAELIKFLAYSGCRVSEAKTVTWGDIDWQRNEIVVNSVKTKQTSNRTRIRRIPINPSMKSLLESMQAENPARTPLETVCRVHECQNSLTNACIKIGINRITHHDLRHLFATRCIESGVDIPTLSRWLGHVDGGALAMRTYGHLRNEHSQEMALKVSF